MAINAFELFAKLSLDDTDFTDKLSSAIDIASGAIAGATTAVVAFSKGAVDVGADFDKSMSQVAATMGKTVDEISNLRDFAQEMGSTTAFSASQSADALNYMALAGYSAEQSMEMLPTVLNLAASGDIELARASDMVTDASSALGLSFEETSIMVDQMAMASSKTNTSVEQLGDAILTVGGNAKTLSGGTQELSQVLGLLADNGIKGSEAGTHLRNIMLQLSPQTDKATDAWNALGVSAYTADGKLRPLQDTFGDLNNAMADLSDQERTDILSDMFGTTDLASVNALLATNADRWNEVSEAIGNSAGSAEQMANTQLDNLTGDLTLFQSALEGVQIAVSDELTPTLREFVQFGSDGLSRITKAFNTDGIDGAMSEFGSILSDGVAMITDMLPNVIDAGMQLIGALIKGIVDNAPNLLISVANIGVDIVSYITNGISTGLQGEDNGILNAISQFISILAEGLLTNGEKLIDIATKIVVIIADGIANTDVNISDNVAILLNKLIDSIVSNLPILLTASAKIVSALIDGIGSGLSDIVSTGADIMVSVIQGVSDTLPDIIITAVDIISSFVNAIGENLPSILDAGIDVIIALVDGIVDAIPNIIEAMPQIINAIIQVITSNLPIIIESGITITLKLIEGIINALPQLIESIPEIIITIVQALTDNLPQIYNMGVNILSSLLYGVVSLIQRIGEVCGLIIIEVENYFSGTYQRLEEVGKNLISGLINGITSMISDAVDTIKGVGEDIISSLKDTLGIHSPSKVFAEIGEFMMLGAEEGVESEAGNLKKTVDYAFKSAIPEDYDFGVAIADSSTAKKAIKQICDDWEEGILTAEEANYEFAQVYKQVEELNAKISQEYSGEREKITQEEADKKSKAYEKYLEKVKTNEEKYKKDKDKLDEANAKAYKDYTDKCLDIEKSYNTKRENLATKGNKALIDISATYYEETAKAVAKQQDNIEKQLEKLADAYEKEVEKIQQNVDKLTDKLAGAYKDYTQLEKDETTGKISVLTSSDLQARADEKKSKSTADEDKTYYDKLEALRKEYQNADLSKRTEYSEKVKKLEEEHKKALETIETTYAKDSVSATEMSMEHRLNTLNDYYASVSELMERGASVEMLGELKGMSADEGSALADYWNSLTDEELSNLSSAYTEMSTKANEIANLLYKEEGKSATDSFAEGISEVIEGTDSFELIGRQALDKVLDGFADKDYVMSKLGYSDVYSTNRQSVVATEKTNSQNNKIDISIGNLNASAINSANQVTEIAEQLAQMIMKGTVTA